MNVSAELLTFLTPQERASLDTHLLALSSEPRRADIDNTDLRILNKQQQIVPFVPNRAQAHLLDSLTGRDLILKARQLGMSTAVQAHLFKTAITQTARIGTLAHDAEATEKLRDMQQMFYDTLEDEKRIVRTVNNATRTYYPQTHSMVYIATAGNKQTGRAGTYSHVHGSEVAFWKDAGAVLRGLMQGVPDDGEIILESTPNGARGWFYEKCRDALNGKGNWALHFYPWWWDEDYALPLGSQEHIEYTSDEALLVSRHGLTQEQIKWRRMKRDDLGGEFQQEYPEDPVTCFLTSGQGYFNLKETAFTAPANAQPIPGHMYIAGLDFGQANDYTVCSVIDATDGVQVELLRANKLEWAHIRAQVIALCMKWGIEVLVAERNSMGGTNIESIIDEGVTAGWRTTIMPFTTTNDSKRKIVMGLRGALESGALRLLPIPEQMHEMRIFESNQTAAGNWTYAAPAGEHDDIPMANSFAWRAAR